MLEEAWDKAHKLISEHRGQTAHKVFKEYAKQCDVMSRNSEEAEQILYKAVDVGYFAQMSLGDYCNDIEAKYFVWNVMHGDDRIMEGKRYG